MTYDPDSTAFFMTPEQTAVLADPNSPVARWEGFTQLLPSIRMSPGVAEVFRTGHGIAWADHHQCLFCGTEKFFRPGYAANLIQHWIPALDGFQSKLKSGAKVADVGCGYGASTLIMAKAYPNSTFIGYDLHSASIEHARKQAHEEGLSNASFQVASSKEFPGRNYDLVTTFDALHDMGDPVGAARHVLECLHPDGAWMIVEPFAEDKLEDNLNPIGRVFYGFSTMVCTPGSRSQEVGLALGAQAGQKRLSQVMTEAGFRRFRTATRTPFNLTLEARP